VSVFEPDILIDTNSRRGAMRSVMAAERRLMVAILADALDCFQKNLCARTSKRRRLFREAEQWIFSDDSHWVFSFCNICDVLGFDASALRAQAVAWKHLECAQREAQIQLNPLG